MLAFFRRRQERRALELIATAIQAQLVYEREHGARQVARLRALTKRAPAVRLGEDLVPHGHGAYSQDQRALGVEQRTRRLYAEAGKAPPGNLTDLVWRALAEVTDAVPE